MNNTIKLLISLFANLSGGIIKKNINDKYANNIFSYQFYNCIVSLISAITLLLLSENLGVSLFTVGLALLFGIITLLQQITNMKALESGPFSYTTVIISLSTLIPTLSGYFFWYEKIAVVQIIGIVLLLVCFVLSVNNKSDNKSANIRWLLFSVSAFVCTGIIGIMQKIHQSSIHKDELDSFLIIAFIFSFVCSGIYSLLYFKKSKENNSKKKSVLNIRPVILMIISGVFVALNNKLNLYLSGVLDSAVFFPVVNGGGLLLTSVAAVVIFKEKLTIKQWAGLFIGIVAVLLICNPF